MQSQNKRFLKIFFLKQQAKDFKKLLYDTKSYPMFSVVSKYLTKVDFHP